MKQKQLFKFGIIADIQYADIDDAANFAGTEIRKYRKSLEGAEIATQMFNSEKVEFVLQLGDLIDGQNAGKYGQLIGKPKQTNQAFNRVLSILDKLRPEAFIFHSVGNHELYNFNFQQLSNKLNILNRHKISEDGRFYFSHKPHPNWKILQLNAYQQSLLSTEIIRDFEAAKEFLKNNPNWEQIFEIELEDGKPGTFNYVQNVTGANMRYVPYNGGLGEAQLSWLSDEIKLAEQQDENVIILSHVPTHPDASVAKTRTLLYDYDKFLDVIWGNPDNNVVKLVLSGHTHRGGFHQEKGTSFVTVQSPLHTGESHGIVSVSGDMISISGHGFLPSFNINL